MIIPYPPTLYAPSKCSLNGQICCFRALCAIVKLRDTVVIVLSRLCHTFVFTIATYSSTEIYHIHILVLDECGTSSHRHE